MSDSSRRLETCRHFGAFVDILAVAFTDIRKVIPGE